MVMTGNPLEAVLVTEGVNMGKYQILEATITKAKKAKADEIARLAKIACEQDDTKQMDEEGNCVNKNTLEQMCENMGETFEWKVDANGMEFCERKLSRLPRSKNV